MFNSSRRKRRSGVKEKAKIRYILVYFAKRTAKVEFGESSSLSRSLALLPNSSFSRGEIQSPLIHYARKRTLEIFGKRVKMSPLTFNFLLSLYSRDRINVFHLTPFGKRSQCNWSLATKKRIYSSLSDIFNSLGLLNGFQIANDLFVPGDFKSVFPGLKIGLSFSH